ncbi:MAG: Nramp family divalent metal transporter [Candidatus Staskawiczbacteria bacterium]|nr:Nramp family divalent metal transporter [Candidatus Staskawiczbacteria bacterium]MBI3337024.1 Nramp family divalent metal transporter [Candidatus Staskawiczbacteria bacterium]
MENNYSKLEIKDLHKPPHWFGALGVGVVVMGLAIGTGELILWPHLITKYGPQLLWAAFTGITFQYFINQEVARHALATGESFFTSSSRVFKWFAPSWLLSAVLLYIWPGWASAIGTILKELFGFGSYLMWAVASLFLVLIFTFSGRIAYNFLEKSLKIIIPIFCALLLVNSFLTLSLNNIKEAVRGMFNFGYIPEGIDISVLIGAIVFAGAGGLLNLCVSLWYRDKQAGMGKHVGRIINPITGKTEAVSFKGYIFHPDKKNLANWKEWMKFIRIDQGIIFWLLGLATLILLSLNAYAVLTPKGIIPEGLNVAVAQAHIFGERWGMWGFNSFLAMSFLMLFSVMWTIIDAFARIVSDILYVNSHTGPFQKYLGDIKNISIHHLYYGLVVIIVLMSAFLIPLQQPLALLTISAVLGGLVMTVYTPVLIYLNNFRLPKPLRPGIFTNFMMCAASLFYFSASVAIIAHYFFKIF